ncbi:Arc family DNA-binding protein [Salinarimonas sp. NSM]|uniref:Arc family DNA-binding protein n=1 Tax=Salinarimonas sp. NSM TaxID=3458003 RepID=UPI004036D9B4
MKQTDPQIKVRLPKDVMDWLRQSAEQNLRSMNAEVVIVLRERMTAETKTATERA